MKRKDIQAPPSPSISSIPVVNRLNRKKSTAILPRATYITPSDNSVPSPAKKDEEENTGPGIMRKLPFKPVQRMMMRGIQFERPDYLGDGVELHDLSIDVHGTCHSLPFPLLFYVNVICMY
jgi:hypothetical protein